MSLEKMANDGDVRSKGLGHIIFAIVLYILAPTISYGYTFYITQHLDDGLTQGDFVVIFVLTVGPLILATILLLYGLGKMKQRARADFATLLKMSRQLDLIYNNMNGR